MDKFFKTTVALGVLLLGAGAFYYFAILLPEAERERHDEAQAAAVQATTQRAACRKRAEDAYTADWAFQCGVAFNATVEECYTSFVQSYGPPMSSVVQETWAKRCRELVKNDPSYRDLDIDNCRLSLEKTALLDARHEKNLDRCQ